MSNENTNSGWEKQIADFKTLVSDVQGYVKATADVVSERATEARAKVESSVKLAQEKINLIQENLKSKGEKAAKVTNEYVSGNPWKAVAMGVAAGFCLGVGFAAGAILRRKD